MSSSSRIEDRASISRRLRWPSLSKSALGVAVLAGALTAGQAQAVVVNVGGQDWDVTTFTGSFNANIAKFQTPSDGGVMPWWTNSLSDNTLAQLFVRAVGNQLGFPNPLDFGYSYASYGYGPFFSYLTFNDPNPVVVSLTADPIYINSYSASLSDTWTWAQATLVVPTPVPLPGPLPIFGAAAAFGITRKLRSRIKSKA